MAGGRNNRLFHLTTSGGPPLVAKFYHRDRWDRLGHEFGGIFSLGKPAPLHRPGIDAHHDTGTAHVVTTTRKYKDRVYRTHLLRRSYREPVLAVRAPLVGERAASGWTTRPG